MNGKLRLPRLTKTAGRIIRVSDFFPGGDTPFAPSYYAPSQTPLQTVGYLYLAPLVFFDVNFWTADGTDIGFVGDHGLFVAEEGKWSYITPSTWITPRYALRVPQYVMLVWNTQTYDFTPGDRPDIDAILASVTDVYHAVQDWLVENRPGKTFAVVSLDTRFWYGEPDPPPVTNDPGIGVLPVEDESCSLIRSPSQAVSVEDIQASFFGTHHYNISVGSTGGNLIEGALGGTTDVFASPTFDRFASYRALQYADPRDPGGSFVTWETDMSVFEGAGKIIDASWGGDPADITVDGLLTLLGDFFGFDPDTGEDLPL